MNLILEEKQAIGRAALDIADSLLNEAKHSPDGMYWETVNLINVAENRIERDFSESIYTGSTGILLFLIEAYRYTRHEKYLSAVRQGAAYLLHACGQQPPRSYSFYSGRMGVAYMLLQLHAVDPQPGYIEQALAIAASSDEVVRRDLAQGRRVVFDFLNGLAGTLFVLCLLYECTGDASLVDRIHFFVRTIVSHTKAADEGVYWDRGPDEIRPICGISHGAGGIGFALLQAGTLFGNECLLWLARQSFVYENKFFDKRSNNWPDLRIGVSDTLGYQRALPYFERGDIGFFTAPREMTAWCHGAPGIGMTRLLASRLLDDEFLKADLERAVQKTKDTIAWECDHQTDITNFGLCHGLGGNALLLLEAAKNKQAGDEEALLKKIAMEAIRQNQQQGFYRSGYSILYRVEVSGLMVGKAGVGYFFLSLLNHAAMPDILLPVLDFSRPAKHQLAAADEYFSLVLHSVFPTVAAAMSGKVSWTTGKDLGMRAVMESVRMHVAQGADEALKNAWRLETERMQFDWSAASHSLLHMEAQRAAPAHVNGDVLRLSPFCRLYQNDAAQYVFMQDPFAVSTFELSEHTFGLLSCLNEPLNLHGISQKMHAFFGADSSEQRDAINDWVRGQVEELLKAGIIKSGDNSSLRMLKT